MRFKISGGFVDNITFNSANYGFCGEFVPEADSVFVTAAFDSFGYFLAVLFDAAHHRIVITG